MAWFALALLSAIPGDRCVQIDAPYFVRVEHPKAPVMNVVVHPEGGILSLPWVGAPSVRQWYEAFDKGSTLRLPGQLDDALEDGRFVVHLHGYRKPEQYELWSWDGTSRIRKLGAADSQKRLAALICNVLPPPAVDEPQPEWFCVAGRLIANDERNSVLVWAGDRWIPTGATLYLRIAGRSDSRLLLLPEDYARVREALGRFSIPTIRVLPTGGPKWGEPGSADAGHPLEQFLAVACGRFVCWAVSRRGHVLMYDLRSLAEDWKKVGEVGNPDAMIGLSAGNDRAALVMSNCDDHVYYLAAPAVSQPPPNKGSVTARDGGN